MTRIPINMPKMSMTMTEGTVVEWLVAVGDRVASGDALVIVTTDKVDMDVESAGAGVLTEISAGPGSVIAVGQPIGWLESESEELLAGLFDRPNVSQPRLDDDLVPTEQASPLTHRSTPPSRVRAVPLARRLAAKAGLDLATVTASGPSGTIRARDVRALLATQGSECSPAPADSSGGPGRQDSDDPAQQTLLGDARRRRMRQATARTMTAAVSVPQFTCFRVLDLSVLFEARQQGLRGVSWTSILLRAYAMLLSDRPDLNGHWTAEGVRANPRVAVALAIDTPAGLYAPVLSDPATGSLRELDARVRRLAEQVRRGRLDPDLMSGATGTLSNLGSLGIDCFNALLTVPQATALSMGRVGLRPVCADSGEVTSQVACEVGLTLDHRVADGADGARALQFLQDLLTDPVSLLA